MSSTNGLPRVPRPANGSSSSSSGGIVATNSVTTREGGVVKTRIDPSLTVSDVVKQLCVNLQMRRPASDFTLRDENDELVTDENLRKKIKTKAKLKYALKPYTFSHSTTSLLIFPTADSLIPLLWRLLKQ